MVTEIDVAFVASRVRGPDRDGVAALRLIVQSFAFRHQLASRSCRWSKEAAIPAFQRIGQIICVGIAFVLVRTSLSVSSGTVTVVCCNRLAYSAIVIRFGTVFSGYCFWTSNCSGLRSVSKSWSGNLGGVVIEVSCHFHNVV